MTDLRGARYLVTGTGKLYHPNVPPNFDQPRSWSLSAPDGTPWPYLNNGEVGIVAVLCRPSALYR